MDNPVAGMSDAVKFLDREKMITLNGPPSEALRAFIRTTRFNLQGRESLPRDTIDVLPKEENLPLGNPFMTEID